MQVRKSSGGCQAQDKQKSMQFHWIKIVTFTQYIVKYVITVIVIFYFTLFERIDR